MNILNWLFSKKKNDPVSQTVLSFIVQQDKSVDLELTISLNDNAHDIAIFLDAINNGKFVPILAKIISESKDEKIHNILVEWAKIIQARIGNRKNFISPSDVLK